MTFPPDHMTQPHPPTHSHEGRILNFKMSESGGQFFIAAKNKFPSIQELISHYHTNPIRSKQRVDKTILLVNPIPVDPQLEATARLMADELQKAQGQLSRRLWNCLLAIFTRNWSINFISSSSFAGELNKK